MQLSVGGYRCKINRVHFHFAFEGICYKEYWNVDYHIPIFSLPEPLSHGELL